MPLSEKDKHTIEVLYKEKGWKADRFIKEFPSKNWPRSSVYNLLKKIDETGSSDRRDGSGRPRTAVTEENMVATLQHSMSIPGEPGTSMSLRSMAAEMGISRSSVARIKEVLDIRTFRRIITPRITPAARTRRGERAAGLLEKITEDHLPSLVFYDEKDLTLDPPLNKATNRVCGSSGPKRTVSPERLYHNKNRMSRKIMVCGAVSYRGKSEVIIVDPQDVKMDSSRYQQVLRQLFPSVRVMYPEDDWIFVQDSAPSHRSHSTQAFLMDETPSFIPADEWPPHSPDCNPLDFFVWNALREEVYRGRGGKGFDTIDELSFAAKEAWKTIPDNLIVKAIDRFIPRLAAISEEAGGPIDHRL